MILPAHRVVQGVHAGVAPMTVEVEFGKGGAAAGQFEELFADQQRHFGGQHFGLGHGKLKIELHAAEALLRKAGQVLDQVSAAPITAQSAARASIAVAEAKVLTTEVSLLVSEKLFELASSRATLAEFNLDRHWRNARVHTLHDPVRWKYHAIGAFRLNGTLPARHSWI